ncbi:hypothetical protein [Sediminibacterium ginsengisoli]|uniref:Uncharacterized protein n=1 Tax=Sediminibacterium ginsengisoli TaxID=413434 RepID=A0A1T4NGU4_9BACT|nr:hypothetical protein [Sediminibacterium ginsengisoli]SJZ78286.1 hypothetical protein SAMN04488132_104245 [Sediminibacterium ginsengisoli]
MPRNALEQVFISNEVFVHSDMEKFSAESTGDKALRVYRGVLIHKVTGQQKIKHVNAESIDTAILKLTKNTSLSFICVSVCMSDYSQKKLLSGIQEKQQMEKSAAIPHL